MTLDRFVQTTVRRTNDTVTETFMSVKYKPKHIGQWMDNANQIQELHNSIISKEHIVISGKSGSGKTTIIGLMSHYHNRKIYELQTDEKRSFKNLQDYICMIKGESLGIFVIDNFEYFFNNVETLNVKDLIAMLYKENIQCIFVVNDVYLSKLTSVLTKRKFNLVLMTQPLEKTLLTQCKSICDKENFEYTPKTLKDYIFRNNCDVRFVLNTLPHYMHFDTLPKFHEVGMYEAFQNVISDEYSLADRLLFFQLEPGTIPVIAHENIFDIQLDYKQTYYALHSMSLADCFHKKTFPHFNQTEGDTYAVLSSGCLHPFKPKVKTPRFGLIWTKQAAKFQKKKYLNEFVIATHHGPTSYIELSYLFYVLNHATYHNNAIIQMFMKVLSLDMKNLFSLYNGYTLRCEKQMCRKNFIDLIK